jgi:hypothetical protein
VPGIQSQQQAQMLAGAGLIGLDKFLTSMPGILGQIGIGGAGGGPGFPSSVTVGGNPLINFGGTQ